MRDDFWPGEIEPGKENSIDGIPDSDPEHPRRFRARSQKDEVLVLGDYNFLLGAGSRPDALIVGLSQPDIPDGCGLVSARAQLCRECGRELRINKEFHWQRYSAATTTGWAVSEAA